ncbi:hypothetical protein, partial [Chryseobacterium indoltheticum]|uniref:hypothetical protein n=1 Tax=Chryseobacterium indoltheticum TaxID=254 RepID=UPI003F49ACE9
VLRSVAGRCLTQVERSRIGVFRIYRETLSRFRAPLHLKINHCNVGNRWIVKVVGRNLLGNFLKVRYIFSDALLLRCA